MKDDIQLFEINDKKIAVKGVAKLFYQEGLPLGIIMSELAKKDIIVSILHVADQLLKNGWKASTVVSKIHEELVDDLNTSINMQQIKLFCFATYEEQREMIFNFLFDNKEVAKEWLIKTII